MILNDRASLRPNLALLGSWAALLAVTVFAYWPGLNGPFVLDDFGAIAALGEYGGVTDWDTFKAFVFGGGGGPTGRPISLLSFLIDGNNWPSDSFPFKRTNLVIHLLNGLLLGTLARQILRVLQYDIWDAHRIAFAVAAIWLLHPFLVSTTLYAVQRMAQLATFFMLAGMITYLHGRLMIATSKLPAYVYMGMGIALFGVLATLSKENGILLPVLIGVLELTIISSQGSRLPPLNRAWVAAAIVVPSMVVFAYLVRTVFDDNFFEIVPPRDFSLYERLLTQPRVLLDYLGHWFVPELYTTGVFQDHFLKSTGLFAPVTTFVSLIFHLAVIALAVVKRHRWPLFAFAVLFFYGSHLLESTVLNLELYFEHRNYLASSFLVLPLAGWAVVRLGRLRFALAVLFIGLVLSSFTRYSANVWASLPSMVEASALKAPTSVRAQSRHAANLYNAGDHREAIVILDRAIKDIPGVHPMLIINRTIILCDLNLISEDDVADVVSALSSSYYDVRMFNIYSSLVASVAEDHCENVDQRTLERVFIGMLDVPQNSDPSSKEFSQIQFFIGYVQALDGRGAVATRAFEKSLRARSSASGAMRMAAILASSHAYDEALQLSDRALALLGTRNGKAVSDEKIRLADIRQFQATVRADRELWRSVNSADEALPPVPEAR